MGILEKAAKARLTRLRHANVAGAEPTPEGLLEKRKAKDVMYDERGREIRRTQSSHSTPKRRPR